MKKISILLAVLTMLTTSVTFTSCSDDDKVSTTISDKELSVSVAGWTNMVFVYKPEGMLSSNDTLIYTKTENTMSIKLISDQFGVAQIDNVSFTEADGVITFATAEGTMNMGMPGSAKKDYLCQLTSGSVNTNTKEMTFVFTLPSVMQGTVITFKNGTAPVAKAFASATKLGGHTSAKFQYIPNPMVNGYDTVTVTPISDNTVSVNYKSNTWGEVTFDNVPLTIDNDNYLYTSTDGIASTISLTYHGNPGTYDATLKSVSISKDLKTYTFLINADIMSGGTTITFEEGAEI